MNSKIKKKKSKQKKIKIWRFKDLRERKFLKFKYQTLLRYKQVATCTKGQPFALSFRPPLSYTLMFLWLGGGGGDHLRDLMWSTLRAITTILIKFFFFYFQVQLKVQTHQL